MIDDRAEVLPVCRVLSLTIYPDPRVIFLLALVIVFLDLLLDVLGDIIVQVFGVQGLGLPANDLVQLEQDAGSASLEPVTVFPGAVSPEQLGGLHFTNALLPRLIDCKLATVLLRNL